MGSNLTLLSTRTDCFKYKVLYMSLMVTMIQSPIEDTQNMKRKKSKHTTTENQITKAESKRGRKE